MKKKKVKILKKDKMLMYDEEIVCIVVRFIEILDL